MVSGAHIFALATPFVSYLAGLCALLIAGGATVHKIAVRGEVRRWDDAAGKSTDTLVLARTDEQSGSSPRAPG
jgi:hypothetical protein